MKAPSQIPDYPLSDYVPPDIVELGIYVGRFEVLNSVLDRPAGMHRHAHYELFWVSGPAVHFNDFEHFHLPANQKSFILVSPGQLHRWEGADDVHGVMISFTSAFFDGREPPPSGLMQMGFVNRMAYPPVLLADRLFVNEASSLFSRCEKEFTERHDQWVELIRHTLRTLLTLATRAWLRQHPEKFAVGRARELLLCFQAAVEDRFREALSVADYARLLGITAGHLNDTVRQLTARTASDFIQSREMLEAKRLLIHSELSVSEVAYHLGFKDPSYFARVFRKSTNLSPADFRSSIREKCHLP